MVKKAVLLKSPNSFIVSNSTTVSRTHNSSKVVMMQIKFQAKSTTRPKSCVSRQISSVCNGVGKKSSFGQQSQPFSLTAIKSGVRRRSWQWHDDCYQWTVTIITILGIGSRIWCFKARQKSTRERSQISRWRRHHSRWWQLPPQLKRRMKIKTITFLNSVLTKKKLSTFEGEAFEEDVGLLTNERGRLVIRDWLNPS